MGTTQSRQLAFANGSETQELDQKDDSPENNQSSALLPTTTPLLSLNFLGNHEIPPSNKNKIKLLGRVSTILAMIPQGIFGGLLMVFLAKKIANDTSPELYISLATATGIPVFLGATIGKIDIVWDFGEKHWERLANKTTDKFLNDLSPQTWLWDDSETTSLHPVLNHLIGAGERLWTINAAIGFGLLARVAFAPETGAAKLATEIGWGPFNWLGEHLFPNAAWQALFGLPSVAANLLSFGGIHRFGIHSLHACLKDIA